MEQKHSSQTRPIFRYQWVSTLALILILGLALYLLLPQFFSVALQPEEPSTASLNISSKDKLLWDDFNQSGSGWPSTSQAGGSSGYQSPSFYYLEVDASNSSFTAFPGLDFTDFMAETKAVVNYTNSADGNFRMGLAVRRSGENYYAFTISPRTNTWQVYKHSPNGIKMLAEDIFTSTGVTFQLFTLAVTAQDKNLSFRINNQLVANLSDPDYSKGDIGFIVETIDETLAHVIFDSLSVQKAEGAIIAMSTPVTPTASTTPVQIAQIPTVSPTTIPSVTSTLAATATSLPSTPTSTSSPNPTATLLPATSIPTASPTPAPSSTATSLPPTLTPSPTSTTSPVIPATSLPSTATPQTTPTVAPTSTPSLPAGTFVLLNPLDLEKPTFGPTDFEWEWTGPVPTGFGFEVRVWREGEPVTGAHDAVQDNQNGTVKSLGQNKYALSVNIKDAAGIQGRRGEYLWTVALVQISPVYADVGQQASPARLRFETPGGNDSGGDGGSTGGSSDGNTGVN